MTRTEEPQLPVRETPDAMAGARVQARPLLPVVAAVVVHRHSANATLACLASLLEHAPGTPIALVLGAEGSTDEAGLVSRLPARGAVLRVPCAKGDGEVAAAEHGIDALLLAHPQLEHVLLLAANARLRPAALQAMRACALKHRAVGAVGCRVVDRDGRRAFERAAAASTLQAPAVARAQDEPSRGATEVETDTLDPGCLLVDAAALRLGLRRDPSFDPDLADVDFCMRLAAIGRAVWLTQAAAVECDAVDQPRCKGHLARRCSDQVRLSRRRLSAFGFARWFAHALIVHPLRWFGRGLVPQRLFAYYGGLIAGLRAAAR